MKLNCVVSSLVVLLAVTGMAQNQEPQTEATKNDFSLTFGLNLIDNSNGSYLPFDSNSIHFKTPFFITAEQGIYSNWTLAVMLSTNQLELEDPATSAFYFSADAFANWYVDDLLFQNENIDLYVGLGSGIHTLDGKTSGSFNGTLGFRYWFSNTMALNFQAIGKVNNDGIPQVDSHYQFNLGATYRFNKKGHRVAKAETIEEAKPSTLPEPEPTVSDLEEEQDAKRKIPEYKENVTVTSTDLAKDPYEQDLIKKNAQKLLNTKTIDSEDTTAPREFHVIIYAFRLQSNLDNMLRILSEKGIEVQVLPIPARNFNYISIAHFSTKKEAYNYIDNVLDKETFVGSWVYEVE